MMNNPHAPTITDGLKKAMSNRVNVLHFRGGHLVLETPIIKLLFENIWVSNLIGGLSKCRGSLLVNLSFLRHKATKLRPESIMVKSSE